MQRYVLLITDQGLDAVMPISNNPHTINIKEKAKIILTFEKETDPRKLKGGDLDKKLSEILQANPGLKGGGAEPGEYKMFDLRARFAGGNAQKYWIGLNKQDMEKIRGSGPYEGAFYILDILINGKTRFGRFDKSSEEIITGKNLNKDWDDKAKMNAKKRRRKMYDEIEMPEEEPDEI
jgi:hypothetical protein